MNLQFKQYRDFSAAGIIAPASIIKPQSSELFALWAIQDFEGSGQLFPTVVLRLPDGQALTRTEQALALVEQALALGE